MFHQGLPDALLHQAVTLTAVNDLSGFLFTVT